MEHLLKPAVKFCAAMNIQCPIILAPMAGTTSVNLAVGAANAGALGSLACGFLSSDEITKQVQEFRAKTKPGTPVNLNLFPIESQASSKINQDQIKKMYEINKPVRAMLKIPEEEDPMKVLFDAKQLPSLDSQMSAILQLRPEIVSWTFAGKLPKEFAKDLRNQGAKLIGTATTVEEAVYLEQNGVDAIVVQGYEAGGHRGTFSYKPDTDDKDEYLVGIMALVPECVDNVSVPVIAAGGIADSRGVLAALTLGASAVQMGTAFMLCEEANMAPVHRATMDVAKQSDTTVTRAFTGRFARGFNNKYVRMMRSYGIDETGNNLCPPYPLQQYMNSKVRSPSIELNNPQYLSMWSGQGFKVSKRAHLPIDIHGKYDYSVKTLVKAKDVVEEAMKLVNHVL